MCILNTTICIIYHNMWLRVSADYTESQANRSHETKITTVNFILSQNEISLVGG